MKAVARMWSWRENEEKCIPSSESWFPVVGENLYQHCFKSPGCLNCNWILLRHGVPNIYLYHPKYKILTRRFRWRILEVSIELFSWRELRRAELADEHPWPPTARGSHSLWSACPLCLLCQNCVHSAYFVKTLSTLLTLSILCPLCLLCKNFVHSAYVVKTFCSGNYTNHIRDKKVGKFGL